MTSIGRSLEDVIIEPVRSILIPGFDELKKDVKKPGIGRRYLRFRPICFMLSIHEQTARK
jgi:homoserine kinase